MVFLSRTLRSCPPNRLWPRLPGDHRHQLQLRGRPRSLFGNDLASGHQQPASRRGQVLSRADWNESYLRLKKKFFACNKFAIEKSKKGTAFKFLRLKNVKFGYNDDSTYVKVTVPTNELKIGF